MVQLPFDRAGKRCIVLFGGPPFPLHHPQATVFRTKITDLLEAIIPHIMELGQISDYECFPIESLASR